MKPSIMRNDLPCMNAASLQYFVQFISTVSATSLASINDFKLIAPLSSSCSLIFVGSAKLFTSATDLCFVNNAARIDFHFLPYIKP